MPDRSLAWPQEERKTDFYFLHGRPVETEPSIATGRALDYSCVADSRQPSCRSGSKFQTLRDKKVHPPMCDIYGDADGVYIGIGRSRWCPATTGVPVDPECVPPSGSRKRQSETVATLLLRGAAHGKKTCVDPFSYAHGEHGRMNHHIPRAASQPVCLSFCHTAVDRSIDATQHVVS